VKSLQASSEKIFEKSVRSFKKGKSAEDMQAKTDNKGSTNPILLTKNITEEPSSATLKRFEMGSKKQINEKAKHSLLSRVFFRSQTELKHIDSISKKVQDITKHTAQKALNHPAIISQREFSRATSNDINNIIKLKMMIRIEDNEVLELLFDYDLEKDTPLEVAKEMIKEFSLDEAEIGLIEEAIREELPLIQQKETKEKQLERIIEEIMNMTKIINKEKDIEDARTINELNDAFVLEAIKLCERYKSKRNAIISE